MSVDLLDRSAAPLAWEQSDWTGWAESDWRRLPIRQRPDWPDLAHLRRVTASLMTAPALVSAGQIRALRRSLARVAAGDGFVVQAGDCAETFDPPTPQRIGAAVDLLGDAASLLRDRLGGPVFAVGRIAGQYGKPRSALTEHVGGLDLPVFRGFLVNGCEPTAAARTPDAARLVRAYQHSTATLAMLRGVAADPPWTSHEALVLDYEEAFVRWDSHAAEWFLTSTHLPWVGVRTHHPDEAHVRFLSGVGNPVGCKVGPDTDAALLLRICARLDPDRRPGRLVLISRMGADRVTDRLPGLVAAVAAAGHPVVWMCDPMHGNTVLSASGHKVRHLDRVKAELTGFFSGVRAAHGRPGGVHLETAAAAVTECVGAGVTEPDVPLRYESACDPRLNATQTMDVIRHVADLATTGPV